MSRKELIQLAENELKPYDITDYDISEVGGGFKLFWRHNGKGNNLHLPRDVNIPRAKENFRTELRRQLQSAGIEKLDSDKIAINDQLKDLLRRLDTVEGRLDLFSKEVESSVELSLEAASGVDNIRAGLMGILGAAKPEPVPEPKVIPMPRPEPKQPQPAIPDEPKKIAAKGLDALEPVRNQKWAEVVERIDAEFELDDVEGRILYFLHECGPVTPYDLKVSRVWRSTDSVTRFLDTMEADKLVRYLAAQKKWGITNEGIQALADEPEEAQPIETPKPTLTVVSSGPRVLETIPAALPTPSDLNVMDALLVYLYKNPGKSTVELKATQSQTVLKGYGVENELSILTSRAATLGFAANAGRGKPWFLTPLGRDRVVGLLKGHVHSDQRRQFVQK